MAKKLNQQDLLKLTSIGTPPTDSVAFAAKSDGLYQKIGTKEGKLATLEDTKNEIPLVIGTQTATTASWAGVLPLDKLESGTTIRYWLPRTSASGVTLNLTLKGGGSTGAINCYYGGTTRLTTHYPAGSFIMLTYLEGALINGTAYTGWWAKANYVDGTESYTVRWNVAVKVGAEVTRYKLLVQGSDGRYYPTTIGNTTAGTKTISTVPFLIGSPIIFYSYTTTVAAGGVTSSSYNYTGITTSNTTYAWNKNSGWRANEDVYLKGTISGALFTLDNTTLTSHMTQDLPTTEDGFYYMRLGISSNTTTGFRLTNQHPIYYFQGGELQSLNTSHGADWNELLNKPTTFAPSGHNHTVSQITNFPTKWDWSNLSGVPTTFAPSGHNHDTLYKAIGYKPSWTEVTNKPSTFAPSSHTLGSHSDVTITSIASGELLKWDGTKWVNNTLAEAGISATSHSHSWSQITSKPSTFAPSEHNHTVAQITNFPTKWAWADLSDVPATFAPSAHSHGNITNDGKIGTTANLMIQTSTSGVLVAKTAGTTAQYLRGDGAWGTPPDTKYTHPASHPASMITGLHASATTGVAGSVAWGNVSGKPSTFAPSEHNHTVAQITGFPTKWAWADLSDVPATFAPSGHTHTWAQVTGKPTTFAPSAHTLGSHSDVTITSIASGELLKWDGTKWVNNTLAEAGISATSHSHSWSQITSKPSTFAPSEHNHTVAQITNFPTKWAWGNLTDVPSTFAPSAHTLGSHSDVTITSIASGEILKWDGTKWVNNTLAEAGISASSHSHSWSQITSKPSTFAPDAHSHSWSSITSKPSTFAPSEHNHTVGQITNFPTTWAWGNLTDVPSTFAPSEHSHSWSSITSKPSSFTPSSHTLGSHSDVTITSIASGEILKWDGTKWVNNTLAEAGISASSHSHSWAQVTGKPTTFAPSEHNHTVSQITGKWAWSNLSGVPATFAPSGHTHGNITNDGKIGATTNLMIQTSTGGVLVAKQAGTNAQYLRGDGAWATPPNTNTTYSAMSVAEGTAGTATSSRTVRADYLKEIIQHYSITGIRAGASGTATNASTTNPYIKVTNGGAYREQIRLLGSGATSISSNSSGTITISSTNTVYTHPASHSIDFIMGLQDTLDGKSATGHTHSWAQITSKPSTFAPATHTHSNISITAGTGLSGGGALSASRTLSIASTYAPNTSTSLGASQNLNNYQTAGFYHQTANANATTALNYPVASAGSLLVQTAAGVIQTYKVYNSSDVYVRGYYSTTWSDWRKLVNASDSIPWARISGAPATATTHPTWAQVTGKPTTFAPSAHSHGNITNDGKIGTTANLMIQTSTSGVLVAKTAGTTAQYLRGDGAWGTPPNTNTTYTAGAGLTLSGTQFSLPVTVSGTGTYVQSVTQDTNGVSVTLGTPPNTNTTYSAMSVAEGTTGTATSLRTMRADYLKQIIQYYDTDTTYTAGTNIQISETNVISATDTKYTHPSGIYMSSAERTKLSGIATGANNYTLPVATATVRGGVELFSNTVQSVAANAVTTTASRTYGIQLNSAGQAVVNVPWSNTNTTYTAGTNIQISGTNVISATDTKYTHPGHTAYASGLYKITVNTLGHVTGATAVVKTDITGLGISEVGPQGPQGPQGDKPSHQWSGTSLRFENPNGTWPSSYVNLKGDSGSNGTNGTNGFTWRPAVNTAGDLTWTNNGSTSTPTQRNIKGPPGSNGSNGTNGFTWRPSVNAAGDLTWTNNGSTTTPSSINIKGDPGAPGAPGLTTSIKVNGSTYTQSGGVITLPDMVITSGDQLISGTKTFVTKVNVSNQLTAGQLTVGEIISTGSITANGFYQSSDIRLKNVIEPLKINIKDILNIPSFYFTYKDIYKKRVSIGTSAQEVQKVFPEIVNTDSKGILSVEYDKFGLIALELIKTQQKEIDSLKYELNLLKLKIDGYRN